MDWASLLFSREQVIVTQMKVYTHSCQLSLSHLKYIDSTSGFICIHGTARETKSFCTMNVHIYVTLNKKSILLQILWRKYIFGFKNYHVTNNGRTAYPPWHVYCLCSSIAALGF